MERRIPPGWCVTFKFRDDHPEFLTVSVENVKQQVKPPECPGNPPQHPPAYPAENPPKPRGRFDYQNRYLGPDDVPPPDSTEDSSGSGDPIRRHSGGKSNPAKKGNDKVKSRDKTSRAKKMPRESPRIPRARSRRSQRRSEILDA